MNKKKITALLLTTFLVSNMTTNFVRADVNDVQYRNQYVQMFQSEPIAENPVPKSEIKATATSNQSGEDASKAIDGNTGTLWHTPWAGVDVAKNPQSLTLDLGKTRNVSSIHITPRQQGNNGIIKDYKIYAGDTVIAEGTWVTNASTKYIILPEPVATDSIRIEALSSVGDAPNKFVSIAEVDVYEATEAPTKVASASNLAINAGQGGDLTEQLNTVKDLEEGTAIIRFTTSGTGIQSLFSISNNTRANEHFHVYVNGGQVGYELRKQSGNVSTGVVSKALNPGINTIAFRAQKSGGYSIYLNGEQILNNNLATANFLKSLEGANTFKLGTTDRASGSNEYNFTGKIDFFEVYDKPLADRYLKEITAQTKGTDLPLPEGAVKTPPIDLFAPGQLGSNNFRIPALYTTKDGTVLASIDVRKGGGHDSPNNIDTGIKRSTDGGVTWDEGKIILDYPGASSAIDTAMVQDEETGRIFLIVTHFAEGYGFPNSQTGSGYKEVDGVRYLKLLGAGGTEYTVRDNGVVYDSNNNPTNYTVDEDQNLFQDGTQVSNVLLSSSPLKVMGTAFLSMIYSDDDGVTWSKPIDLNKDLKAEWMRFFGTGPGRGHQVKNGPYAGRLLFPIYVTNASGFQSSAVIYSDDNGVTWEIGETATDGRPMSDGQPANAETITTATSGGVGQLTEAQVVEMPNGQLKMFMRNTGGNSGRVRVATSFDGGATWDNDVVRDEALQEPYCQMTVMNYSQKIDGKDALIFANPNAGNRSNGTVRVGLITENGTHTNGEPKYDIEWKYSKVVAPGTYAYSCLSEMPNGEIGLFYEGTGSQEMSFTRMNVEYLKADLLADAPSAKVKSITSLDEDSNYLPGDVANLKVTFDQAVSLFGDRNLTFIIDGKEVTGAVTKISGKEYKITVTLPQDITAGTHPITIKAKEGLDIVNVINKKMNLSENITTSSSIVVENEVVNVDKTGLQQEVDNASTLVKDNYTPQTWNDFKAALDKANTVLQNEAATQAEVDEAKSVLVSAKNQLQEFNKIFGYSNLRIINGSQNGNISSEVDKVKDLESGTIVMRFDNKGGNARQALLSFSNNNSDTERFNLYITGNNRIGYERQSVSGMGNGINTTAVTLNEGINTIALRVDAGTGYSIFINGVKTADVPTSQARFTAGINGLNSVNIGRTDRATNTDPMEMPLTGDVDFVNLYGNVLSDFDLIAMTTETKVDESVQAPTIKNVSILEASSTLKPGDEITVNVEVDQVVSMIGTKALTLLAGKTEIPVVLEKQVGSNNFVFKGTIPADIKGGNHTISIKAMTGLDIVNIKGQLVDLSNNIDTSATITVEQTAADKTPLQEVVDSCAALVEAEYTVESWKVLTDALTAANDILAKGDATQAEVDAAKVALEEAIAGLEKAVEKNATFNLKAAGTVKATEAIDIKLSVDEIGENQTVQSVDATLTYDADKFQLGENAITAVDGSKTFVQYRETEPGTVRVIITSLGAPVVAGSDIVNIKLTAKDSLGTSDITMAGKSSDGTEIKDITAKTIEIEVVEKEAPVDKSLLQALVDQCLDLNEADYTTETWATFASALENARGVLANGEATQAQVDLALGQLEAAKDGLVEKEEPTEVFKKHLEITVEVAEGITDFTDVVPAVKAEFDAALAEAVALLANPEATQEQVNKSFDRLSKAIHMLEFKGNKEQLMNLLAQIEALDSSKYTKESWDALQAVINRDDIQEVINDENALQADIEKAYSDIFTAFSGLVEVSEQVNKDKLNNLIGKVENLNSNEYIEATWNNFFNALNAAKAVSANADATQAEVDQAYESLLRAYLDLRLKPSKDKLEDLINKAEGLDASKYTAKSYKAVEKALKSARTVYADEKATAEDIAKAEKNLEVAMANLQAKSEGSNNGGNNNNGQGSSNNGSGSNGGSSNSGKLPNTGGTPAAAVGLLGTISAAIGAVMFKRKRK